MLLFPVLPIIVLLLGAAGTLVLSSIPAIRRYARYVALAAAAVGAILVLILRWLSTPALIPSHWEPSYLFGTMPVLQAEPATVSLALLLAIGTFSALLLDAGRAGDEHARMRGAMLVLLAVGMVVLWSGNVLALIASWAVLDVVYALVRFAAGSSGRAVVRGLAMGNLATLLVWGGALLSEDTGALTRLWPLMGASAPQMTLWALAGVIRIALYPLHLSMPDDVSPRTACAALLYLQPIFGWGLWLRIVQINGGALPDFAWLPMLALLTMALGGVLAWTREATRRVLPYAGMAVGGAVLLAGSMAGERASPVIVAGSTAWALGTFLLRTHVGFQRRSWWWSIPALVGALALSGMPLTLGFVAHAPLIGGLMGAPRLGSAIGFFIGYVFLVPALVRLVLAPPVGPAPVGLWQHVAQGIGSGAPAVWLAVAGLFPLAFSWDARGFSLSELFAIPGLAGWLLWVVGLVLGGLLAWQERNLRPRAGALLGAVHDLLRLEWLYDGVTGAADRGLAILRAADEIVGGAGALLWSFVLFIGLLLVIGS